MKLVKATILSIVFLFTVSGNTVFADNRNTDKECPVGLVNGMTLDDEFGYGASEITRCLKKRKRVKMVMQINQLYKDGSTTADYGLSNLLSMNKDYEITNGMKAGKDYKMAVVLHGTGALVSLNNQASLPHAKANPFQSKVEEILSKGIDIYLCQNTARKMKIKTHQLIPGVKFVTAGLTALSDFQQIGYSYIQP